MKMQKIELCHWAQINLYSMVHLHVVRFSIKIVGLKKKLCSQPANGKSLWNWTCKWTFKRPFCVCIKDSQFCMPSMVDLAKLFNTKLCMPPYTSNLYVFLHYNSSCLLSLFNFSLENRHTISHMGNLHDQFWGRLCFTFPENALDSFGLLCLLSGPAYVELGKSWQLNEKTWTSVSYTDLLCKQIKMLPWYQWHQSKKAGNTEQGELSPK